MYHPPATRSRTASDSKKPPSVITTQLDESYQRPPFTITPSSSSTSLSSDINMTIEHLQQLLIASTRKRRPETRNR
ncbi:hypothetical protein CU098_000079 [Rhizopus stolonifer]|uniref:Uncharacterized protein n=1 Tax=Rhizopus stolonifer TaxID=4846 RepID=A0A367ITW6_RHIST|nr:hypothetical protein CU098_000079 [Rhizopus stolonifer]